MHIYVYFIYNFTYLTFLVNGKKDELITFKNINAKLNNI
jgi:hypothetical protein